MALTYKQKKGPSGVANLRILKNSVIAVFDSGDNYEFPKDDLTKDLKPGKYVVGLSPLRDKIGWVTPPPLTSHIVQFKEFGNRVNGVPEPELKRGGDVRKGKNGGTYITRDELRIKATLEVVEGDYKGLHILFMFPYAFEPVSGTPFAEYVSSKVKMEKTDLFLRACGLKTHDPDFNIKYSGNVLPFLETDLQRAGGVFSVSLNENGFVDTISPLPSSYAPKAKKAAPKAKKVTSKRK